MRNVPLVLTDRTATATHEELVVAVVVAASAVASETDRPWAAMLDGLHLVGVSPSIVDAVAASSGAVTVRLGTATVVVPSRSCFVPPQMFVIDAPRSGLWPLPDPSPSHRCIELVVDPAWDAPTGVVAAVAARAAMATVAANRLCDLPNVIVSADPGRYAWLTRVGSGALTVGDGSAQRVVGHLVGTRELCAL